MPDKVTISLYSVESNNDFNRTIFKEKDNIAKIKDELTNAAKKAGRIPPEFVISISLIPDWTKPNNSYTNPNYLQLKQEFLQEAHKNFGDLGVTIEDFYEDANLTLAEQGYLHGLQSKGSNADIIKTRAIINNQDCRHLQIDSNTKIPSYKALYKQTFGAPTQEDALNAALYDTYFVSVHNKIVYTVPQGKIAPALEKRYLSYCKVNQHKASDKNPTANAIYSKAFCPAMSDVGLATAFTSPKRSWPLYRANMTENAYRITGSVVTAVNMSWRKNIPPQIQKRMEQLKSIPEIQVGSTSCDSSVFTYLVKKYTVEELSKSEHDDLLNISNTELDKEIIVRFYENTRLQSGAAELQALAETFPNTKKGNQLCREIFGCPVSQLHANSNQQPQALAPIVSPDKIQQKEAQKKQPTWSKIQQNKVENKNLGTVIKNLGYPSAYVFDVQDTNGTAHKAISFKDGNEADDFAKHNSHDSNLPKDDDGFYKVILTQQQALQLLSAHQATSISTKPLSVGNQVSEQEKKKAISILKEANKQIKAIDASYVGHNTNDQAIKDQKQLLKKQLNDIITNPAFLEAMSILKQAKGNFHVIEKSITEKMQEIRTNAAATKPQANLLQAKYSKSQQQDTQSNIQLAGEIKKAGGYEAMIFDLQDTNGVSYKEFSFKDKSQATDFANHFSNTNISQAGVYQKVILSNQQTTLLQKQLKDREDFLIATKFSESLKGFEEKAKVMLGKAQDNNNSNKTYYATAHPIAQKFCENLQTASQQYLKTGNKNTLQTECQKLCNAAKISDLKNHREWKGAIAKFVTDVLSTLTCGLLNLSMFTRTDTVKKLDDFEQTVVNKITGS